MDRIDASRTALVLVDYQARLLPAIGGGANVLAHALLLADAAALLTHVRSNFGNHSPAVSAADTGPTRLERSAAVGPASPPGVPVPLTPCVSERSMGLTGASRLISLSRR